MTKRAEMQGKLQAIYDYISETVVDRGYPPTVREICDEMNIKSTSSAFTYLRRLEEDNKIRLSSNTSRGMEILGKKPLRDKTRVPYLGTITAGEPVLAFEDYMDAFDLPNNLFHMSGDMFMLNVEGTSMIDVGIRHGDKILVKKQSRAENGQIVAALVDGEYATVKRFYLEGDRIRLHPENSGMRDIYPEQCAILGVVVGLIRTEIK